MTPASQRFNPFPGLRPFQIEEEYLFFGRETQRKELVSLLRAQRFVGVLGASGSGKSSLVRAGLLPALFGGALGQAGSHWNAAMLRPGGRPIASLAQALIDAELWQTAVKPGALEVETALTRSGLGLVEVARQARMPAQENLLVVVDQFEELFRFSQNQSERGTRDEAAAFVSLLIEAARQTEVSIYVVLTMRSDFFGDCSQFEELADAINRGEYLVPRLTRDQKKEAITGPIHVGGGTIAPRLLQRLLNDVGDDPDQLPILQHALMRTWDQWTASRAGNEPLDLHHYEAIGTLHEALSRHADEVFEGLPDDRHRAVAEKLFKALTERGADNRGVRRPTLLLRLGEIVNAQTGEIQAVADAFRGHGRTFLMPPENVELAADTVLDISHESLMRVWQRLRRWVEEEAQSARVYTRLAETATLHAHGKAGLYHDPDLQIALAWQQALQPTAAWAARYHAGFDGAMAFLQASAEERRAAERAREAAHQRELEQAQALAAAERQRAEEQTRFAARLRWLVRGLGIVAMLAVAASVGALLAWRESGHQASRAEANRETAEANAQQATRQARIAEEQRHIADQRTQESQKLAGTLKTTLTRADFITASDELEAGDLRGSLSHLARAMRTDPDYVSPALFAMQALSERTVPLEPPLILRQDKPIEWWSISDTKDSIWTVDIEDYGYLWNARTGERIAKLAEGKQVDRVHFTRDGRLVFTAIPSDGTLRGWDARTGQAATPLLNLGHGFGDYFVNGPTNGSYRVLVQGGDGSVQVWDATKGLAISPKLKAGEKVLRFGFSPNGAYVFGAFDNRVLALWEAGDGRPVAVDGRHGLTVSDAVFSPDGRFLVLSSQAEKTVAWWDLQTSNAVPRKLELPHPVRAFLFDVPGRHVAVLGWADGARVAAAAIHVAELETGRETARVNEPKLSLRSPQDPQVNVFTSGFDPSRRTLRFWAAAGIIDGRGFRLWDLTTGQVATEFPLQESPIEAVQFSPDGGRVALALENRQVRVWDALTGKPLTEPIQLKELIGAVAFSGDGEKLIVALAGEKTVIHTYDSRNGQLVVEPFELTRGFLEDIGPAGDRGRIIAMARTGYSGGGRPYTQTLGEVVIWDAQPGAAQDLPLAVRPPVSGVRFSPDGSRLVVFNGAGRDSTADIWGTASRRLLRQLEHPEPVIHTAFSPDGKRLFTGCDDYVARVWDVATGDLLFKLPHAAPVWRVVPSPNGGRLLTVTFDGVARVWDMATGNPLFEPIKVSAFSNEAAFAPDGRHFALTAGEQRALAFETETGRAVFTSLELGVSTPALAYTLDGEALVVLGFGTEPRVLDARTGELLRKLPLNIFAHTLALHPGGSLLATGAGGNDETMGAVQLWDWRQGQLAAEPLPIFGRASDVAISPDGRWVAGFSIPGDLKIWEVATGRVLSHRGDRRGNLQVVAAGLEFSSDSRLLAAASRSGILDLIPLPTAAARTPEWFPELAEAISGNRLNELGARETVPQARLTELRQLLQDGAADDPFARWARWFVSDRRSRPVAPGASQSVAAYARQLGEQAGPLTNRFRALQLAPNDAHIYAHIAFQIASSSQRTNILGVASNLVNATALWYAEQATNLAPDEAEVWALRAGTLLATSLKPAAIAAAGRAVALDPRNPSVWYHKAITLAAQGAGEDAYQAFLKALDLLPEKTSHLDWLNQLRKPALPACLNAWMDVRDRTPLDLARLGRQRVDDGSDVTDARFWEARWLTRRATELLPQDREIWRLRSQVLLDRDEEQASLEALRRAAEIGADGQLSAEQYGPWLRERLETLDRVGPPEESRRFALSRGIPPRPAAATPDHLDLTGHYNVSLWESPHRLRAQSDGPGPVWKELPRGLSRLAGVEFDVRGLIQLSGQDMARGNYAVAAPRSVEGIRVGRKAQWLHFLHTTGWGLHTVREGTSIGRYRLHYADGRQHELPIVAGSDVLDWFSTVNVSFMRARRAWFEQSAGRSKALFISSWENPFPDAEITALDVVSDMTRAAPMLVAISLELPRSDSALASADARELAAEALSKLRDVQGVGDAGKAYARKLSAMAVEKAPTDIAIRRARAEVLARVGQPAEATPLLAALEAENVQDHTLWYAKAWQTARAGNTDAAVESITRSLRLLPADGPASWPIRARYIREAADWLKAAAKVGPAREFTVRAQVPARPTDAPPQLVDLSPHYNGGFDEQWFVRPNQTEGAPPLRTLTRGVVTLQSVSFDARGVIQLNDRNRRFIHQFPNAVTGIRVGAKGHLLHFLQGCSLSVPYETVVARFRVHYAGGEQREIPVRFGLETADFYFNRNSTPTANVAWRASNGFGDSGDAALYLATWENPLPDTEILRIDFDSELTQAQPFLVALTLESMLSTEQIASTPAPLLAQLALDRVNPKARPGARTIEFARRLSDHAIRSAGTNAQVWRLRAGLLANLGDQSAALAAIEQAIALDPADSGAWQLKVDTLSKLRNFEALPAARAELRRRELAARIPPRAKDTRLGLVDLTGYYNVGLTEAMHEALGVPKRAWESLASFPAGHTRLGGVEFDARGVVHLAGARFARTMMRQLYPDAVNGLRVAQKARRLHFLHGAGNEWAPDGTVIAHYVVHYTGGRTNEVPVTAGGDVRDWFLNTDRSAQPTSTTSKLAWRGPSGIDEVRDLGVYLKTWDNPQPETEISHIDFVCTKTDAAPFLLAITVE